MSKDLIKRDLEGLPPWLAAMRQAAMEAISTNDVSEIVKKQVDLAKKGDAKAIKFVFENVLGGQQFKGATFVQNNYTEGRPDKPTLARPGTNGKMTAMAQRAAAGLPLTNADDGPEVDES